MDVSSTYASVFQTEDYSMAINETFLNSSSIVLQHKNTSTPPQIKTPSPDFGLPAIVADNSHIVIPLMSFVFGFPVLVMTVLCIIQERNKWIYERQAALRLQQARLSTTSTLYTARSMLQIKDSINPVAYANSENILRNGYEYGREETTVIDSYGQRQSCMKEMHTKLSDETLEEIDEFDTDTSKMFNSISMDKTSFVIEV